jgi:hypothetical protein
MTLILTEDQQLENIRIRYQLAHGRIKELASYIRITDAAIWGFLIVTFLEFFKDNLDFTSYKIPLFLILLILSMIAWRYTIRKYQRDITTEYEAIKKFETILEINDNQSMAFRHVGKMSTGRFRDEEHIRYDYLAIVIVIAAMVALTFYFGRV